MLQNIKQLYGNKLAAIDGTIGHVKDFYFDDKAWAVRYLVADTGTWLTDKLVLLSPHAFGRWDRDENVLHVNLTRKQIEDSPSPDTHQPVSRQYEEDYYRYYGWPNYWQGAGMWGLSGFPLITPPLPQENPPHHGHNQRQDLHLRSAKDIIGYQIQATDGAAGAVSSLMVDDKTWALGELVVDVSHWFSKTEILITVDKIQRISYEDSTVYVNLTMDEIKQTAEHEVA